MSVVSLALGLALVSVSLLLFAGEGSCCALGGGFLRTGEETSAA